MMLYINRTMNTFTRTNGMKAAARPHGRLAALPCAILVKPVGGNVLSEGDGDII